MLTITAADLKDFLEKNPKLLDIFNYINENFDKVSINAKTTAHLLKKETNRANRQILSKSLRKTKHKLFNPLDFLSVVLYLITKFINDKINTLIASNPNIDIETSTEEALFKIVLDTLLYINNQSTEKPKNLINLIAFIKENSLLSEKHMDGLNVVLQSIENEKEEKPEEIIVHAFQDQVEFIERITSATSEESILENEPLRSASSSFSSINSISKTPTIPSFYGPMKFTPLPNTLPQPNETQALLPPSKPSIEKTKDTKHLLNPEKLKHLKNKVQDKINDVKKRINKVIAMHPSFLKGQELKTLTDLINNIHVHKSIHEAVGNYKHLTGSLHLLLIKLHVLHKLDHYIDTNQLHENNAATPEILLQTLGGNPDSAFKSTSWYSLLTFGYSGTKSVVKEVSEAYAPSCKCTCFGLP